MTLVVVWRNLLTVGTVLLPSLLLTLLLVSLVYHGARGKRDLPAPGPGRELAFVDVFPPEVALAVMGALTALAMFVLFDSTQFSAYVLPYGLTPLQTSLVLTGLFVSVAVGASLIAAYLLQVRIRLRDRFLRVTLVASVLGLIASAAAGAAPAVALLALFPMALVLTLLAVTLERGVRPWRMPFGVRTLGLAALPLYLVAVTGFVRLVQLVTIAG